MLPAARSAGWENPGAVDIVLLVVALLVIVAGSAVFTNGIEWIGEDLGLSDGAVGSVLAAIGTALPETALPFVAILTGHGTGNAVGVGAILGGPFMLGTLGMCLLGASVLRFARSTDRPPVLQAEPSVIGQDLGYFSIAFALGILAGVWHLKAFRWVLAVALLAGYGFYVYRHFHQPGEEEIEKEASGEIRSLYFRRWVGRLRDRAGTWAPKPPLWAAIAQTLAGLAMIVGGARLFVDAIDTITASFHIPSLPFALLVAPVATELPELMNSVLWIRRRKDTLAAGNVTGAMVFQATFPMTIGLLGTSWRLNGVALAAAVITVGASTLVWLVAKVRRTLTPVFLVPFGVAFVVYAVLVISTF
jgi:cation:H+ antiporter